MQLVEIYNIEKAKRKQMRFNILTCDRSAEQSTSLASRCQAILDDCKVRVRRSVASQKLSFDNIISN